MPYQIIHNFEGLLGDTPSDGLALVLAQEKSRPEAVALEQQIEQRLLHLREGGIDGLVVNVGGGLEYLDSAPGWELLRRGMAVAVRLGFKLWIYDERGYPSGSAGGLTLRDHPEFEARGIKFATVQAANGQVEFAMPEKGEVDVLRCEALYRDGRQVKLGEEQLAAWSRARHIYLNEPGLLELRIFYSAALFEGAHAARNYGEKRRYINLLDPRAVEQFINLTYNRYAERLPSELFAHVEAFFTDEPSFMSVVIRELEGELDQPIPVYDTPDPAVPILASVPYSDALRAELQEQYHLTLDELAPVLFSYDENPSAEKCAFWEAAARVYERAYAMPLAASCERLGKKLTGHLLFEETPFDNMIFHANPFRVLKHFQLPGVDLLSSNPQNISIFGHKLPFSCAFLTGKPGIMTETSDFVEYSLHRHTPAPPETMAAALSLQFLLGVRAFSYYYNPWIRDTAEYRWVNEIVRRTCEFAKAWRYAPAIALYCPYESLWSGYVPSRSILSPELINEQPEHLRRTQRDVLDYCDELFRENIPFILCDESSLGQLAALGVNKVIVPECQVVAQALVEAGQRGALELYGHKPTWAYQAGRLQPVGELEVRATERLDPPPVPFQYEDGLRIADFQGQRYYCFNLTDKELALELSATTSLYDPFEGSSKLSWQGKTVRIAPGRALFLHF